MRLVNFAKEANNSVINRKFGLIAYKTNKSLKNYGESIDKDSFMLLIKYITENYNKKSWIKVLELGCKRTIKKAKQRDRLKHTLNKKNYGKA